jgi:hypothetical protein
VWSSESDAKSDDMPATSVYQISRPSTYFSMSLAQSNTRGGPQAFEAQQRRLDLYACLSSLSRVYSEKLMSPCVARA